MPPCSEVEADVTIVGAGLAGLSIVCWLIQIAEQTGQALPRVHLLEPRQAYKEDRTWCFWDDRSHPFSPLIKHRWPAWQVRQGNRTVTQSSSVSPYAMLHSMDVYRYALNQIDAHPSLTLHQGVTVETIEQSDALFNVRANSMTLGSKLVIDTRPPNEEAFELNCGFWQVFSGQEIQCVDHGFAPDTARLMDFQACETHVAFVYLLPISHDRLLVEWTEFLPPGESSDCDGKLHQWLEQQNLTDRHVLRTESGRLPMFVPRSLNRGDCGIPAGIRGGWMRPSTGYHFASCQRCSESMAKQLLHASLSGQWQLKPERPTPVWLRWMDRVFMRSLQREPSRAADWFMSMFQATSGDQMARFMNDQPRWDDAIGFAASLPKWPFLRSACGK